MMISTGHRTFVLPLDAPSAVPHYRNMRGSWSVPMQAIALADYCGQNLEPENGAIVEWP